MKKILVKIECITNLHAGSGDINFNIVDNEVEKDPVNDNPIVHSSGIKGALKVHFEEKKNTDILYVFGGKSANSKDMSDGKYKFLEAVMMSRPMRVSGSDRFASIPVISIKVLNDYLGKMAKLDSNLFGVEEISIPDFKGNSFLCTEKGVRVEGEDTGEVPAELRAELEKLESVIGKEYAIVKEYKDYPLPVVARNQLANGQSKQLWYEEVVPAGSVFCTVMITPDEEMKLGVDGEVIQIGGNASVGCGFTKFTVLKQVGD